VQTKTLRFPLGLGFAKTSAFGKNNFPVRVLVGPVVRRPWQKHGPGTLRKSRAAGR
jgi:hypothetical protein